MWLMGFPSLYEFQASWECTFLKVFTYKNTKGASKKVFTDRFQNQQQGNMANLAMMGRIGHFVQLVIIAGLVKFCVGAHFVFLGISNILAIRRG